MATPTAGWAGISGFGYVMGNARHSEDSFTKTQARNRSKATACDEPVSSVSFAVQRLSYCLLVALHVFTARERSKGTCII